MLSYLTLSAPEFAFCAAVAFLAGCVRGFAGFGLSAVAMACLVLILPPIELIPVFYILEGAASLAMFRGGLRDGNIRQVWPLALGSAIGVPIGLFATTTLSPEWSKTLAVLVILTLTILQFSRKMPAAFSATTARYILGTIAGIVTGLASVGGLVIALYVLSSRAKPKEMRATLTLFLFIGMFTSLIYMVLYGVMTSTAILRGGALIPATLTGVALGTLAFRPAWQMFYRTFCLLLLIGICVFSLWRMAVGI